MLSWHTQAFAHYLAGEVGEVGPAPARSIDGASRRAEVYLNCPESSEYELSRIKGRFLLTLKIRARSEFGMKRTAERLGTGRALTRE